MRDWRCGASADAAIAEITIVVQYLNERSRRLLGPPMPAEWAFPKGSTLGKDSGAGTRRRHANVKAADDGRSGV
jgi:hypothetical protein